MSFRADYIKVTQVNYLLLRTADIGHDPTNSVLSSQVVLRMLRQTMHAFTVATLY